MVLRRSPANWVLPVALTTSVSSQSNIFTGSFTLQFSFSDRLCCAVLSSSYAVGYRQPVKHQIVLPKVIGKIHLRLEERHSVLSILPDLVGWNPSPLTLRGPLRRLERVGVEWLRVRCDLWYCPLPSRRKVGRFGGEQNRQCVVWTVSRCDPTMRYFRSTSLQIEAPSQRGRIQVRAGLEGMGGEREREIEKRESERRASYGFRQRRGSHFDRFGFRDEGSDQSFRRKPCSFEASSRQLWWLQPRAES